MSPVNPIIIVTGANRGVGFGICHRLLVQLSQSLPPDSVPPPGKKLGFKIAHLTPCDGITLILACRDVALAEKSRAELLRLLDASIARQKKHPKYDGHADKFRQGVRIEIGTIDLAVRTSVLGFAKWCQDRFTHISHLICNAGIAPFDGIDPIKAIKQMCLSPGRATTTPNYLLQTTGMISRDGLGLVWQSNVFGHYMLYRALCPLLSKFTEKSGLTSRVIWMSTMTAFPDLYEQDDLQLIKTCRPYEASKYQLDLTAAQLNMSAGSNMDPGSYHFVVQPGVLATNLDRPNSKGVAALLRSMTFSMARVFNSYNHPSSPYKAAISATHAALIGVDPDAQSHQSSHEVIPIKFHSRTPLLRKEYVSYAPYPGWTKSEREEAEKLLQSYDKMYSASHETPVV